MTAQDDNEIEFGGPIDEAAMSLAIYGESLIPSEISSLLGLKPTSSFEAGYKRGPQSPPIPHGAWFYEVRGRQPLELEDLSGMLLAQLPDDVQTWATLNQLYRVQVRVALHMETWNRGFGLSHAVLTRLARTGAELTFDIYNYANRDA